MDNFGGGKKRYEIPAIFSVADPGFSRSGTTPKEGAPTYYLIIWPNFYRKQHENVKSGHGRPLGSINAFVISFVRSTSYHPHHLKYIEYSDVYWGGLSSTLSNNPSSLWSTESLFPELVLFSPNLHGYIPRERLTLKHVKF